MDRFYLAEANSLLTTTNYNMTSTNYTARTAGFIYLLVVLTGIFSLAYVPSTLIVPDNPVKTLNNIKTAELLFRFGIFGGLLCYVFFLFLPVVLYKLLKPVHESYATLMVLTAIMSVPVFFLNSQHQLTILSLLDVTNQSGLPAEEIQSQVMQQLDQYKDGMRIVHIFSGLWLLPFGYLVFKSGFLPKIFGVLLMLGCFGYLINFTGYLLIPTYSQTGISSYISLPASIGEIGICLWLLIMGVKDSTNKLR